jgi:hypothetical protein
VVRTTIEAACPLAFHTYPDVNTGTGRSHAALWRDYWPRQWYECPAECSAAEYVPYGGLLAAVGDVLAAETLQTTPALVGRNVVPR